MKVWIAGAALFAVVFTVSPRSADACSCMMAELADKLANSHTVFEGTAVETSQLPGGALAGRVEYRFALERSFKGTGGASLTVGTAANSAACGSQFEIGTTYVVFASDRDGQLGTNLCAGNLVSTPELIAEIEQALGLGEATPPDPNPPNPGDPEPSPEPTPLPPAAPPGNPACGGCSTNGGGGGLSVALLILLLAVRRRRRR